MNPYKPIRVFGVLVLATSFFWGSVRGGAAESPPASEGGSPSVSRWRWLAADASQVSIIQPSGGNTFSGALTWAPSWEAFAGWTLRLDAGAALLKGRSKTFIAPRGQLFVQHALNASLKGELGGGMQDWTLSQPATSTSSFMYLMASGNIRYRFSDLLEPFAGYSSIFQSGALAHEFRLGVGVSL